jgi:polyketide biosynthesis enoyl-CoA hydratase PksH
MSYETIKVRFEGPICFLQFYRPEANNALNNIMVEECNQVMAMCEQSITIVVLEGLPEIFCLGADFQEIHKKMASRQHIEHNPVPSYELWLKMATGPYITVSHVRGKAIAGGVGFVAASDIVLADQSAQFSLSELLFGLFPACVFPFLIRKIGLQKAHYMSLMTQPISVQQAQLWGLVDAYDAKSDSLLRKHLLRLKRLSKKGITRYKSYIFQLNDSINHLKSLAVNANKEVFSDPHNINNIFRFVEYGKFPWED